MIEFMFERGVGYLDERRMKELILQFRSDYIEVVCHLFIQGCVCYGDTLFANASPPIELG
jgi:hypothetical protein